MQNAVTIAVLATLVTALGPAAPQAKPEAGDVQVTVTYTGKGQVDATHEVWVFLFDTPTPGQDNRPLATETITKQGGTAAFKGVTANPVYVFVAYDEKGDYDGNNAPPPNGTPIGMYSTNGTEPSPIQPGPDAKVKVSFDDSRRMGS
jgi:hypothetical protein